jgi:hypothetical protein
MQSSPQVARASQPGADGPNPFGIAACERHRVLIRLNRSGAGGGRILPPRPGDLFL